MYQQLQNISFTFNVLLAGIWNLYSEYICITNEYSQTFTRIWKDFHCLEEKAFISAVFIEDSHPLRNNFKDTLLMFWGAWIFEILNNNSSWEICFYNKTLHKICRICVRIYKNDRFVDPGQKGIFLRRHDVERSD